MKQYCLSDIHWIYTQDGKFVTPFIFNNECTKIKDLASNDAIIELPQSHKLSRGVVIQVFAEMLNISENDLKIGNFRDLQTAEILKLKGIKNLKFLPVKDFAHRFWTIDTSTFIVTEEDIHRLTKEIIKNLGPKTKKQKDCENLHNLTSQF